MHTSEDLDNSRVLLEQVNQALHSGTALRIQGANSKLFLGRTVAGEVLDTRNHRGIVSYDPTELVITARCGTPLAQLTHVLEQARQMLPCEPPAYAGATVGGMIASGLSGSRRPWAGSVRDYVLGTRVITGHGKHLRFGGEVMKNVAGYDLSRLMAGSYGSLGVITEVSLKVLPKPRQCLSISLQMSSERALLRLADWGGAQRWLKSDAEASWIRAVVAEVGGHATCYSHGLVDSPFQPLPAALLRYQRSLKYQLDPQGIFNPGRLYAEL